MVSVGMVVNGTVFTCYLVKDCHHTENICSYMVTILGQFLISQLT